MNLKRSLGCPGSARHVVAVVAAGSLLIAACGDDDDAPSTVDSSATGESADPGETDETDATDGSGTDATDGTGDSEASEVDLLLTEAVDTTLGTQAFTLDSTLSIEGDEAAEDFGRLSVAADGQLDYAEIIGEIDLTVDERGAESSVQQRFDGSTAWVHVEGDDYPAIPDGAEWIEGDVRRWRESGNLEPAGVLGPIIVLKGSAGAEEVGSEDVDGESLTEYSVAIDYDDAVAAAGSMADALQSGLSLRSPEPVPLEISVSLDDDGVIRRMEITDRSDIFDVEYSLVLDDVGQPVDAPEAPEASTVLTGSKADELLDQLFG